MHTSKKKKLSGILKSFFHPHPDYPEQAVKTAPAEPWSERDTLVGVLRNEAQLDIALEHKFYHIPAKYISEYDMPIKYVAIYQSKNLFGNKAGIYYCGEVESYKCIPRKKIHEIPKNSPEYYYRFNIKEWKTLKNPIEAKELGFVRIYTNHEMMCHSTEMPQLLLKNKDFHDLYTGIKNAVCEVQSNPVTEPPIIHYGDFNILIELDDIVVFRNTTLVNSFSVYDFMEVPNTIMIQIYKLINRDN